MKTRWILLAVAAVVLVGTRLILPGLLKTGINRTLERDPELGGRVETVDLHMLRGAGAISGLLVLSVDGKPLLTAESVEFSLQWSSLLRAELKARIKIRSPRLNWVKAAPKPPPADQPPVTTQQKAGRAFPFEIARLEVTDGTLRYQDPAADPKLDVFIDGLDLVATDISNRRRLAPVATLDASGRPMGVGRLTLHARFDTMAAKPRFDLEGKVQDFPLAAVEDLIRAYGGVYVSSGTLDLYTEVAVKDGSFTGYVKPFIKDLEFAPKGTKGLKMREMIKGEVAQYMNDLLENHRKGSAATKIEFSGKVDHPKVDAWEIVRGAFGHAFTKSLKPGIENSVENELAKQRN